jgi:tryptophan-rich sensory protein
MHSFSPPSRLRSALAFAGFAGLCAAAASIGGRATIKGKGLWYRALDKPSWNPPDWVFGPVWSGLFTLMAVSAWRVYKKEPSAMRSVALGLWMTQLGLNTAWSVLFFGEHKKAAALLDLGLLTTTIGGYMAAARKVDRTASLLMLPYLGWCGFAAALNEEIVRKNPD